MNAACALSGHVVLPSCSCRRAEEAQRQLQAVEGELMALLEGPVGALLSYTEAHAFAEALRGAALEAQQRGMAAKVRR